MADGLLGVVLAGGRSSRMGQDKALLEIGGTTLLARATGLLHDVGATRVVLSGNRPDHGAIPDARADAGPVGGISSAVAHSRESAVIVIPVDQPRLDRGSLQRLVEALAEARAACFQGHPLPWAARVDDRLRAAIDAAFAQRPDGPSMHALHALCAGIALPAPPGDVLCNVNTPEDWAALQ